MSPIMYIPIFGKLYPVFHVEMDSGLCGDFNGEHIRINLAIKRKSPLFLETLLHEMGHALFCRGGLRQAPGVSICIEEVIVEQFANMFCEAFTFYQKQEYRNISTEISE